MESTEVQNGCHLAGPAITFHTADGQLLRRQRCMWCGALLENEDLARMAWTLNEDGTDPGPPGGLAVDRFYRFEGEGGFRMLAIVEDEPSADPDAPEGSTRVPDDCCMRLDPAVTE